MALAIFDLDNTLLKGDSDHAWGEYLVEKNVVDKEIYKAANDKFLAKYQNGCLDIHEYLSFALKPLAQNSIEDLLAWRKDFFERIINPIILPKGRQLIQEHKSRGDFILIITATNRFVTEIIADELEVDDLIATEPETNDSGYTGRVKGVPSFQDGKIIRLNSWIEQNDYSLEGSYFYSDSHNDLPLLKVVENPVAVDPDTELSRYCQNAEWPIISLRD